MAASLTVYCVLPVDSVTASDLTAPLGEADLYTVAEGFDIDDEAVVDEALARLKVEPFAGSDDARFRLSYAGDDKRPVFTHIWDETSRVQTERDEALEDVDDATVTKAVQRAVAVVGIELGWTQLEDIGVVLAGQIAEAFASAGSGVIRDQNDDWWAVQDGVPTLIFRPTGDG